MWSDEGQYGRMHLLLQGPSQSNLCEGTSPPENPYALVTLHCHGLGALGEMPEGRGEGGGGGGRHKTTIMLL